MTANELYKKWQGMKGWQKAEGVLEIARPEVNTHFSNADGSISRTVKGPDGYGFWQPHEDLNQAALVVAEIEQQGLWREWTGIIHYLTEARLLGSHVKIRRTKKHEYKAIAASADTRCAAAFVVTKMQEKRG